MDKLPQEEINTITEAVYQHTKNRTADVYYIEAVKAIKEAKLPFDDYLIYRMERIMRDIKVGAYCDEITRYRA